MWKKQLELLSRINPDYVKREIEIINGYLAVAPFTDGIQAVDKWQ